METVEMWDSVALVDCIWSAVYPVELKLDRFGGRSAHLSKNGM